MRISLKNLKQKKVLFFQIFIKYCLGKGGDDEELKAIVTKKTKLNSPKNKKT